MSSFAFRMFKIDWRLKTAAFRFFETFPLGEQLYFFTQRNITRTYPRLLKPTNLTARRFVEHAETNGDILGPISAMRASLSSGPDGTSTATS